MPNRNPNAQSFSTEIDTNFEGGLVRNNFVKGTMFIFKTIAQRNALTEGYRLLDNETTTLAMVVGGTSPILYELTSNPATGPTTDSDWTEIPLGNTEGINAVGEWDASTGNIVETGQPLLDTAAVGNNGDYYVTTGAPNGVTNLYPGLFRGITVTTFNSDVILSVGSYWAIVRPAVTWETLNVPQVITDYENGIVIPHPHEISDVNGLNDALNAKYDVSDQASKTQNFDDIPGTDLVDLTFQRQYYYRKNFVGGNKGLTTYNAAEIDSLLSAVSGGNQFDWTRPIRKLPAINDIPGGSVVTDGLEEIYYGTIKTEATVSSVSVVQIGESSNPTIKGSVTANDGTLQAVYVIDHTDAIVATVSFTPGDTFVDVDETLAIPIVPIEADPLTYRIRADVQYLPDVTTIEEKSDAVPLTTVYPILVGMANTGLGQTDIYAPLTKLRTVERNTQFIVGGSTQRIYFAYPEDYNSLSNIKDSEGVEVLIASSLFTNPPTTIPVDSAGLDDDWTKNYKVYESNYDLSLTAELMTFYFRPDLINTSDDVPEGLLNLYLQSSERQALGALPSVADIGDMFRSIYDPQENGIVDASVSLRLIGKNITGGVVAANTLVSFAGWDDANEEASFIIPSGNLTASAVTLTATNDQETTVCVYQGFVANLNTSGQAVADPVYLASGGSFGYAPGIGLPPQPVGIVGKVGTTDGAIFFEFRRRHDIYNPIDDWRTGTVYDQLATVFYTDANITSIFRSTQDHTAGPDFLTDLGAGKWQVLTGDMLQAIYDPGAVLNDAFGMDNMSDGSSQVAMTTAERIKLAGLQDPIFKGIFLIPDDLRIAYPTSDDGDNAQVVFENNGTTPNGNVWLWDSAAPVNPSPPTVGGDWVDSGSGAPGDMRAVVYDPTSVNDDAFAMENMAEETGFTGPEKKVLLQSERDKLAGIEAGAQVNQDNAAIKTQYESNADTNAFQDAEKTKLVGVEDGAEANQSDAEIKTQYENNADTNAYTDTEKAKLAGVGDGADMAKSVYDILDNGVVDQAHDTVAFAFNDTGGTVAAGKVVYISSADAGGRRFKLSSNIDLLSIPITGWTLNSTNNGEEAKIALTGVIAFVGNIPGTSVGDSLFLAEDGDVTPTLPVASDTVISVLAGDLVGRVGGIDYVSIESAFGIPAKTVNYENTTSGLIAENAQEAIDEVVETLTPKELVMGTMLKPQAGVALGAGSGEIGQPTVLSAFATGVNQPVSGRLAVNMDSNVMCIVNYSAEHLTTSQTSTFTVHVNGVAVLNASNRNSSPTGNQGTPSDCSGSISVALQLNAGDYVSVFHTGSAITLYEIQISLHGQEQ